jgi:hypothetical protein
MSNKDSQTSKIWLATKKTPKISKKCPIDSFLPVITVQIFIERLCRKKIPQKEIRMGQEVDGCSKRW